MRADATFEEAVAGAARGTRHGGQRAAHFLMAILMGTAIPPPEQLLQRM